MDDKIPIINTTTNNSINVKPCFSFSPYTTSNVLYLLYSMYRISKKNN